MSTMYVSLWIMLLGVICLILNNEDIVLITKQKFAFLKVEISRSKKNDKYFSYKKNKCIQQRRNYMISMESTIKLENIEYGN